jgi:hypothetical protein
MHHQPEWQNGLFFQLMSIDTDLCFNVAALCCTLRLHLLCSCIRHKMPVLAESILDGTAHQEPPHCGMWILTISRLQLLVVAIMVAAKVS